MAPELRCARVRVVSAVYLTVRRTRDASPPCWSAAASPLNLAANKAASMTMSSRAVTPEMFCHLIAQHLTAERGDEPWARGARGLCDLYAGADAARFDLILHQLARGSPGSAIAEGARWLLPRWIESKHL
jgi:hypothetical protein